MENPGIAMPLAKPSSFQCRVALALACVICPAELVAQCVVQKLTASDSEAIDQFGRSVSISGDVAVVGHRFDECQAGPACGATYVYRFDGSEWYEEQKLTASDADRASFGWSVSNHGNVVVVGAPGDDCHSGRGCGAVYVYRFDGGTWVEEQKLTASNGTTGDQFGMSVSVSGDVAVVGAGLRACVAGPRCGAAYVYRYEGSTWTQEQTLTASDASAFDVFGISVAASRNVTVVGAVNDDCVGDFSECGAAYVYRFEGGTWVEEQKLTASDAEPDDWFGFSVSLDADTALIGAPGRSCAHGPWCGTGYVYRFNGARWIEEQRLIAAFDAAGAGFGKSVSVASDVAVVGADGTHCATGFLCGSAYVYRFNDSVWIQEQKLTAFDAMSNDRFGWSVSVSGDLTVVGAIADDCSAGADCGSTYVFALGPDCNGNGDADFCDIRDGVSRDDNDNGIPDDCEVVQVVIDIRPRSERNRINLRSRGVLPVAILTTSEFDATTVDPATVELSGANVATHGHGGRLLVSAKDVDRDGDVDLLLHFKIEGLDLEEGDAVATLTGLTSEGIQIDGSDTIYIVPSRPAPRIGPRSGM